MPRLVVLTDSGKEVAEIKVYESNSSWAKSDNHHGLEFSGANRGESLTTLWQRALNVEERERQVAEDRRDRLAGP